ncbi:hypothetical protein GCM10023176_48150 [Micromonospora coerulea]|uniref:histidine kinase n=1 Tax=Micromonospora coerulea TaxID=47856 RepID=A0ABP8SX89_9ACTN
MGRLAQWRRIARAHPALADALLATVLFVVSLLPVNPPGGPPRDPLTAGAVLLALVGCGALALRRRYPLPVLGVTLAAVVLALVTHQARGPFVIAVAIAGYTVATRADRRTAFLAGDAPTEPAPSLNRLDALVEGFAAGQPVRWSLAGQPRPLPSAVDVAAYRIIQESLTNAYRHAPGAAVAVRLRYDPEGVTIEVRDDGAPGPRGAGAAAGVPGPQRPAEVPPSGRSPGGDQRAGLEQPHGGLGTPRPAGLGLLGMRERAEAVGGVFSAGPRPEGGFLVRAELPAPEELAE